MRHLERVQVRHCNKQPPLTASLGGIRGQEQLFLPEISEKQNANCPD